MIDLGDITKINPTDIPDFDIYLYSYNLLVYQEKKMGFEDERNTFFDICQIIDKKTTKCSCIRECKAFNITIKNLRNNYKSLDGFRL
jgi:hypothetical protein